MPTVSRGLFRWLVWRGATLEDFADRLNHFWTFGLLILSACTVSWKQGSNKPIHCFCRYDTASKCEFLESVCWSSHFIQTEMRTRKAMDELGISTDDYLPPVVPIVSMESIEEADILSQASTGLTIYQWLPLIFCFQALLFKLPNILMYILHGYSGISFEKIAGLTDGFEHLNLSERELLGKQIARYVYHWCKPCENFIPWRCLTLLWFSVKFLFCINIIVQVCILDGYLKTTFPPYDNSTSYGDAISGNIFGNNATLWRESPVFPRTVSCSIGFQQSGSDHPKYVPCNLPMNAFNEFVCMFLWVWFIMVSLVTCLSLLVWLCRTLVPLTRSRYISRILARSDEIDIEDGDVTKFSNLIGEDGVMVLKLIGANSSELIVQNVVCSMWRMYIRETSGIPNPREKKTRFTMPKITVEEVVDNEPGHVKRITYK